MSEAHTVTIKGRVYEIPPLNTGQVKKHWGTFTDALKAIGEEGLRGFGAFTGAQSDLLLMALRNEYPELTMDDVDTLSVVDLNAAVEVVVEGVARPKAALKTPTET